MEEKIRKATDEALVELGGETARAVSFAVEWPTDMAHGDYAVNAALVASKALGKNPRELASELAPLIAKKLGDLARSVAVAGPGFINVTLSGTQIRTAIENAVELGEQFGTNDSEVGKKVMIEYSNPNSFKEIHIGHLMSNVIGESLSRIIAASGATVLRDTFGGDVGPHVAKALWGLMKSNVKEITSAKEIGNAYIQGSNAYEESPEAKKEIDELNTRIYDVVARQNDTHLTESDRELLDLWRTGREISMEEFERLFALLGTKFDYVFYDSDTTEIGMRVVHDGLERGIFKESEGAIIYEGKKKGLHTLVFITSRGTPTYETKDIGLAFLKEERDSTDEVLIVTAVEQIGHFNVFLAALEDIAPLIAKKTKHVAHGLLHLSSGKMSSRKGNVITADELLEEVVARTTAKNPDPLIAEQVAVGAVKYMILRQSAGSNITFDVEKSLSLEGDSGPYLQYALVRAKSIIAQKPIVKKVSANAKLPEHPYELARLIIRFPEVVARAQKELSPHYLAHYLTELAGEWNSFYAKERVIGGDHEEYKLQLAYAFVTTMENGLNLLGIPAPEKM